MINTEIKNKVVSRLKNIGTEVTADIYKLDEESNVMVLNYITAHMTGQDLTTKPLQSPIYWE